MRGSSRAAAAAVDKAFEAAVSGSVDFATLADELFAVTAAVDGNATLRRALADPSREVGAKRALAQRLFGPRVSAVTADLTAEVAGQRWADERDLSDTLEALGVQSLLIQAERSGRIDAVEDELFRFERIVASDASLRDTLSMRNTDAAGKAGLVRSLLSGKARPETIRLAEQAVSVPRGRRLDRVLVAYLTLASRRRDELTALVTIAAPITAQQTARLRSALEAMYGKPVTVQTVLEPDVMGGIRVQVGDEVVDGTIIRRLDEARRHITGA